MGPDLLQRLVEEATAARESSYSPYSGYAVGAALMGASGTVYRGCNVENAAYSVGICAERTALVGAVCAGERSFLGLAVVVGGSSPAAPCGVCRQMLAEFTLALPVVLAATGTTERVATTLSELLPRAFTPANLSA